MLLGFRSLEKNRLISTKSIFVSQTLGKTRESQQAKGTRMIKYYQ